MESAFIMNDEAPILKNPKRWFRDGNFLRRFSFNKPFIMGFIELSDKDKIIKKEDKLIQDSTNLDIWKEGIKINYEYPKIENIENIIITAKYTKKFKDNVQFNDYLFQKYESWFTDYAIKEVWDLKEGKLIKIKGLVGILEYNKVYKQKIK